MKTTRTTSIELLRFIAALAVMTTHFGIAHLGGDNAQYAYVVVDFFFMLAGFFMIRHIDTHEDPMAPGPYLLHKVLSFYAILALALCAQMIFYVMQYDIQGVYGFVQALFHFKWEALLLHCAGTLKNPAFNKDYLLGQDWYLSAMMLGLVFTYPLARYATRIFRNWVAPVVAILFYAGIVQYYGTLNVGSEYLGFISLAIVRGVAGICLGSLAYSAWKWVVESARPSEGALKGLSVLEVVLWAIVLTLFRKGFFLSDTDAVFYVIIFFVLIVLSFWDRTWLSHFLNTHGTGFLGLLGSLSLYMYLFHWTVISAIARFAPGIPNNVAWPLYFVLTIAICLGARALMERRKSPLPVVVVCVVFLAIACGICVF